MTLGGQFTVRRLGFGGMRIPTGKINLIGLSIATAHDATPGQIALAWLRHRSPTVMPIPGTSSVAHLEDDVAAADLQLDDADLAQLDEVARN
jgi:aryl-alcohol dehydrogenase-like predicted oxidoreductase